MIYVCETCRAEVTVEEGTSGEITWKTYVNYREGVASSRRVVVVIHMRPPENSTISAGPCGLGKPKLGEPDELAISEMALDEVMGHAAAALRRVMPEEKAVRLIATLNQALLWGQSVDHETQERADALREALRKALIPLGPVEGDGGYGGYSDRTIKQLNRARRRIMEALQRDDRWKAGEKK